ncbi:MAG: flavin reductase [Helicobacter sp.]|nr:flavin reductase [Helicobacter sp.]
MTIKLNDISALLKFKALSSLFTPRPIAWVSSVSQNGVLNLAPFSFFGIICADPIILSISISNRRDGSLKDSAQNISFLKKCAISFVNTKNLKKMEQSSSDLAQNQSEFQHFGIKPIVILEDYPAVPDGVLGAFFCDLHEILNFEKSKAFLLKATNIFIDDSIFNSDFDFNFGNVGISNGYTKSVLL